MNDQYVRNVIEAALLAAGRPLASDELVTLFDERDGSNADEVRAGIEALRSEYETRGLEVVEVLGFEGLFAWLTVCRSAVSSERSILSVTLSLKIPGSVVVIFSNSGSVQSLGCL